jgi:hypothetical protein
MNWDTLIDFLPTLGLIFVGGLGIVFWLCMLVEAATQRQTGWVVILLFLPVPGVVLYWACEYRLKHSREAREEREILLEMEKQWRGQDR